MDGLSLLAIHVGAEAPHRRRADIPGEAHAAIFTVPAA